MILGLVVALLAGLATAVGGALALRGPHPTRSMLAVALAFAAGAMVLISLVQIIPLGIEHMGATGATARTALTVVWVSFFVGIGIVLAIDRFLPEPLNPNEMAGAEVDITLEDARVTRHVMRSGLLTAVVLGLHNFPEGMATFFTTYQDPQVGITLAIAIAIHNVPEGIAVAAPIYAATGSKTKAFWWATLSGLTEPMGALVAAFMVGIVVPPQFFGVFYGMVAGMMVFLALDELLPGSWRYQTDKHQTIYGMLGGMAVMALSLVLFAAA
ncbi:MAG: zinc transporter ZupT [bacterium]|nr:zinc transporter ZupT [bacterium]